MITVFSCFSLFVCESPHPATSHCYFQSVFSLSVLLHLSVFVTINLSCSLPLSLKSPRAAFGGACAHARCATPIPPPPPPFAACPSPASLSIPVFGRSISNGSDPSVRLCPGQSLHTSTGGGTLQVKKVQKNFKNNYASVECGAKILSANSEAKVRSAHTCTRLTMSGFVTLMFSL